MEELEQQIVEQIKTVYDPEIPINIYELGLIYGITVENHDVLITMTLTSPHCPVAEALPQQVKDVVAATDGVDDVTVELVWDPPWTMERMTDEARLTLGLM